MASLTKEQRDLLPKHDFGDPHRRLYPVVDQDDLNAHAKTCHHHADAESVKGNLRSIAARKGLSVPAPLADAPKGGKCGFSTTPAALFEDDEDDDDEDDTAKKGVKAEDADDADDDEDEDEDDDDDEGDQPDDKAKMSKAAKAKAKDDDEDDDDEDDDDDDDDTDYEDDGDEGDGGDAEMSVGFSLTTGATTAGPDGYVLRKAPIIFRAGNYPDKSFSMSPEEMMAATASFSPVDIDLEHKPSVLDRKLGKIVNVHLSDDGWTMGGEALIPTWLDSVLGRDERKLSATFDRVTKKLIGCSLVRNPRVSDATLMAAFAAYETGLPLDGSEVTVSPAPAQGGSAADPDGPPAADHPGTPNNSMAEWRAKQPKASYETIPADQQTPEGSKAMKAAHDAAADAGACAADDGTAKYAGDPALTGVENARREATFSARREARRRFLAATFAHDAEAGRLQLIHDAASNGGCFCRGTSYEAGVYGDSSRATRESGPTYPQQRDDEQINDNRRLNQAPPKPTAPPTPLKTLQTNAADSGTTPDTSEIVQGKVTRGRSPYEGFSADAPAPAADPAVAALQDQVRRLQTEKTAAEAVNFADTEIAAKRSLPADREALIAGYTLAAQDDARTGQTVAFDGQSMTRVEFLKRQHLKRLPHNLTAELVPTGPNAQVVFGASAPPPPAAGGPAMSEERRKELLAHTPLGRSLMRPRG
jgi:hypothetical protein